MQKTRGVSQSTLLRRNPLEVAPLELEKRIELCRGTRRSNCRGTALFLLGAIDDDVPIRADQVGKYLNLDNAPVSPKVGSLIAWHSQGDGMILHLAVVTSSDPLLLTHRDGSLGRFVENQPFDAVNAAYNSIITTYVAQYLVKPTITNTRA